MKMLPIYAALLLTLGAANLRAQGGALDLTFGTAGKVTTDLRQGGSDLGYAALVLPDGRFLVAGSSYNGMSFDFSLACYLQDGALDTSFGNQGKVLTDFDFGNDYAFSMALQPDGGIVLAGYTIAPPPSATGSNFALARYLPDGTPDPGFGFGGKRVTALSGAEDIGRSVLIQPDGKIIVAGYVYFNTDYDFALVRYWPDGTTDNGFGNAGIAITAIGQGDDYALTAALQTDGKILVGGDATNTGSSNTDFTIARFLPDGTPDTSFASGGILFLDIAGKSDLLSDIAIQPDGKIVMAGSAINTAGFDFALARLLPDGGVDSTFGENGRAATDFDGNSDVAESIRLLSNGNIAAVGYTFNGADFDFALARYLPDGALDGSFSNQGTLIVAVSDDFDWGNAAAAYPDGKILAAGFSWNGSDFDFALFRCDADGNPDPAFGTNGIQTTSIGHSGEAALASAIQSDGKIVAVGPTSDGFSDYGLVRYLPDGTPDAAFGNNGRVVTDLSFGDDFATALAVQSDGKLVVGGRSLSGNTSDFSLARYHTDGSLDSGFGNGGTLITSVGPGSDIARALVVQADGKIVQAGTTVYGSLTDFALVRYNPDGELDDGFGTDGKLILSVGDADAGYALALQPDGKIILGGFTITGGNHEIILIRFLPDGQLDPAFANGGIMTQSLSPGQQDINALAVQSDGKIVAAGVVAIGADQDFLLLRTLPDGTPDAGFGDNGIVVTDFGGIDVARALALYPDGRTAVGGYNQPGGLVYNFAMACYLPDGTPDASFGIGGLTTTDFDNSIDQINGIAIQPDGKIIAAGYTVKGTDRDFALARYLPGLSVGVLNFSTPQPALLIYPNPIRQQATLEYVLASDDNISIRLLDSQGKLLQTFVESQAQQAGARQQVVTIPDTLPSGWYVLVIAGEKGQQSVRVVVE